MIPLFDLLSEPVLCLNAVVYNIISIEKINWNFLTKFDQGQGFRDPKSMKLTLGIGRP